MKMLQMKKVALAITLIGVFGNARAVDWLGKQGKKNKELFEAVWAGNAANVKTAIKDGADVNAVVDYSVQIGYTPLLFAVSPRPGKKINMTIVDELIKAKANVNAQTQTYKYTPLNRAVLAKSLFTIDSLQQQKALVEKLIKAGANVNLAESTGKTPLYEAVGIYDPAEAKAMVELLLKAKANPNLANKYGETPLVSAVERQNKNVVGMLLNAGAKVTNAALGAAVKGNDTSIEKLLKLTAAAQ